MAEILIQYLRHTLNSSQLQDVEPQLKSLEAGEYQVILDDQRTKELLIWKPENAPPVREPLGNQPPWAIWIKERIQSSRRNDLPGILIVGLASLYAFLQSNVTGPPLPFSPADVLLLSQSNLNATRQSLLDSLRVDGESAYKLTPNIELFCLARVIVKTVAAHSELKAARWANTRIDFIHQRLMSETAPSLQSQVVEDIKLLKQETKEYQTTIPDLKASLFLEIASIQLHFGDEKLARESLEEATKARHFQFALTGRLGRRTKFQQNDMSQLVVLAKSSEGHESAGDGVAGSIESKSPHQKPVTVELNDDTILDSISFTKSSNVGINIQDEDQLPDILKTLDAEHQPQLHALDSIILLSTATSITNTSPSDGLTREETLPYATRVLEGGSSNWQVYTQALLIRSRIEGYKSRTVERGLLQLQALVDQVIADTSNPGDTALSSGPTTFLPRPKEGESAPAHQRLLYVFQLASPARWELEAELASRWISLGGLKSALDIYERLEMWAEVALCWAGIDREDKGRQIVRKQLFEASSAQSLDEDSEQWTGPERKPSPPDAPRLYCILGDFDKDPTKYERAWEISGARYPRAQRSLGRYWYAQKEYSKAVLAFSKAVKIKQLDHATWFAMGCALLELDRFAQAAEVFSRAVQLDDQDAESWSNLAAALLNQGDGAPSAGEPLDPDAAAARERDPQKNRRDALQALRHAVRLRRDSHRIWDNLLAVAAALRPPAYADMVAAQTRIIELRGAADGERCVDERAVGLLVRHVTASPGDPAGPGLARMVARLVDGAVIPLITSSAGLWLLVARLDEWRGRPGGALEAEEKAWRAVTVRPGWEHGTEAQWEEVVEATVRLAGAYGRLGRMERTGRMAAGSGELVRKDWRFKARSAIRGILGRGGDSWGDSDGWQRLNTVMKEL